jgi:hypothetical protein
MRSLMNTPAAIPGEAADASRVSVHEIRGERVVLDHEVARLFGFETKKLNQQITRNKEKFRDDFAFRLTKTGLMVVLSELERPWTMRVTARLGATAAPCHGPGHDRHL